MLIISFLYYPDPSSKASVSEGLESLPGGVTQALSSERSELLVTSFLGNDCCIYLLTVKTSQEVPKNTQMNHLDTKHFPLSFPPPPPV